MQQNGRLRDTGRGKKLNNFRKSRISSKKIITKNENKPNLKWYVAIAFTSPRAQPEVVGFLVSNQGSEISGRNRFLPGRMEETGKKVFLPVSSRRKWKKLEESGRNRKKYMKPHRHTNKLVEISFQILLSKYWHFNALQICISQISGILCPAQCCPIHFIISCIQGLNMLKCLHLEHLIFHICFDKVLPACIYHLILYKGFRI